jgi:hypothetical protein
MSIASQCPDCCECPVPVVQWDSVSAAQTKCGWNEFASPSNPPKVYRRATVNNLDFFFITTPSSFEHNQTLNGLVTEIGLDCAGGCLGQTIDITGPLTGYTLYYQLEVSLNRIIYRIDGNVPPDNGGCGADYTSAAAGSDDKDTPSSSTQTVSTYAGYGPSGTDATVTLSAEYTTADLIAYVAGLLTPFPETWAGTAGSFRNLSTDERSYAARISRYRIRFKAPQTGTGKCYRVSWVERFVPEAGVTLDSREIIATGVYRPGVTVTGDGDGASVVPVMASDGSVDFFRVLNPGANYTTITITCDAAINGGTTATCTGNLLGGQLASVTKTASGNYLPSGMFLGGGGSGATIAFTMDSQGGLASVTVGSGGTGFTVEPSLTVTPKVAGTTEAVIHLHLGTETERCVEWGGELPEDYDADDSDTWPILGDGSNPYFELAVPEEDGSTFVANVRAFCDCAACPEPEEEP